MHLKPALINLTLYTSLALTYPIHLALCNVCKSLGEVKRDIESQCNGAIKEEPQKQEGAFDDQESFMLSRQINTELGAFYNYLALVGGREREKEQKITVDHYTFFSPYTVCPL